MRFIFPKILFLFEKIGLPHWVYEVTISLILIIFVVLFVILTDMFLIWLERKVAGRVQNRLGPMRVAYPKNLHGWAQSFADAIKLLLKEDIINKKADRWIFTLAPILVIVPAFASYAVVPFTEKWILKDLNIGILYILAISSLVVIGILMGGWSSNNKYSLLGAMRSCAQLVSYEVPLVLSILVIVMLSGSLSMQKIVAAQKIPFILFFPTGTIAFLVYLIAATAEINRVPFDIPEAESELVAGYNTEYSGIKWAFFFLAEYANLFLVAAIATTLFLGGWKGIIIPFLPTNFSLFFWFLFKCYLIILFLIIVRWTFPRVRVDQLMVFSWKFLLPLSLVNIFLCGIFMLIFNKG